MSTQADDVMQTPVGKQVREQVLVAKRAARPLASASAEMKNAALLRMADDIEARREVIQAENEKDLRAGRENGLTEAPLDRLDLTDDRVATMADG
ncbi:MAG: gamma-glutamyl-phosphate reductase, partial [Candidatus Poribacteria bacterium]